MHYRTWLTLLAVALILALPVQADTVRLRADHPTAYTVVPGDTLWDISGRFLHEPWRWPDIWRVNPQIRNPHLIYPGDVLALSYEEGRPVLRVRTRGRPTVRLSPRVRAERIDTAIPAIPVEAIHPFLIRPAVVGEGVLEAAPYVVSVGAEALIGRPGTKIYARGLDDPTPRRYSVFRQGPAYVDPTSPNGEILGYEALHVGDAVLDVGGDPATLYLLTATREVLVGDRLMAHEEEDVITEFLPRAPATPVEGRIIAVVDGVSQIGQHQVVVINVGREHGIEAGHVMAVWQRGLEIHDPLAPPLSEIDPILKPFEEAQIELDPARQGGFEGLVVAANDLVLDLDRLVRRIASRITLERHRGFQRVRLPDERAGTLMVFRPFDRLSYALVMSATRPMHVEDVVRNP